MLYEVITTQSTVLIKRNKRIQPVVATVELYENKNTVGVRVQKPGEHAHWEKSHAKLVHNNR